MKHEESKKRVRMYAVTGALIGAVASEATTSEATTSNSKGA